MIIVPTEVISWDHIEDLYKLDSGACEGATAGLCLVPKLTYEHIHLTSFSKMRVDLAAQVSYIFKISSLANLLQLSGDE